MPTYCDNCGHSITDYTQFCDKCTDMAFECADFLLALSKYMTECYGVCTIHYNIVQIMEEWKRTQDLEQFQNSLHELRKRFP